MQTLKSAAVVFCTACICAELLARLTGNSWARRCIKAVAGLYILVVLLQVIPQLRTEVQSFSVPDLSPASMGTLEDAIQAELDARSSGQEAKEEPFRMKSREQSLFAGLLQKQNRTQLAIILGAAAMLLILFSELFSTPAKPAANAGSSVAVSETAYREQLETQLKELIEQLDGAGKTVVMVTLESGEETIYAVDTQSGQMQNQETHVLLEDGSALEETTYLPAVCGVAVVCDGGGDVRVAARITELVRALLDLSANRICVEQRKG